jgi:tetratricopeptide (TPR) repeat protein
MMNTDRDDNRELLDLLGEPARDDDGGDAPAASRAEFARLLTGLRGDDSAEPSVGFNESLRGAWNRELAAAVAPTPGRSRRWWGLSLPLAAAAVIAFVLLWPGGFVDDRTGGGGVAWADVVKAMDRVSQFHVIVFDDSPRSADDAHKMLRFDLFYSQPDRWRAHGMGHVGFVTGGKRQTWSVAKRGFLPVGEHAPDMLPQEFVDAHGKLGTLGAILATVFGNAVPQGEPVKSDDVASAQGIDVFDYARKASEKWARIWVLRESKLPLKMHLYYPGSDNFTLINFDYSDPQPGGFFDPAAFATQAAKLTDENAYRYYGIGSTPVAGTRPRGADQIHAVEGGYKAPQVKRVASNDAGDVLVVTSRVDNLTPTGHSPHAATYQRVTDTWGNEFLIAHQGWGNSERGEHRWVFAPHPPFKRGTGARRITVTYTVEPTYGERTELATETLDVPDPSVQAKPSDWPGDLAARSRSAWREYLRHNGTLAQQLEEIDGSLAKDPAEMASLSWKFSLLREHGREGAAWALFEGHMRDRIFTDPKVINVEYVAASQYLLYLASQHRDDELRKLSDSVRKMIEAARASKDRRLQSDLSQLLSTEHSPLPAALRVLEWREQFKDGPQVVRTLAGRDGLVFVELAIPKPPEGWQSNGWDGEAPYGWFWQPTLGDGWQINARLPKPEEGRLWFVVRGNGKQIPLSGEATLALDNYGDKSTRYDAKVQWKRAIDVPEPTVDDMKAWWTTANGKSEKGWWPLSPASTQPAAPVAEGPQDWMHQADQLRDAGKYLDALELYRKTLAAPRDEWPPMYTQGVGLLDTVDVCHRRMRVSQAQCLAELGRLDESRRVAAELRATLPDKPDLTGPLQGHIAADALAAELYAPRAVLRRGDAKAASAELDRIGARRPRLADLPVGMIMVDRGPAKFGWGPRSKQEDAWRAYDTLWWEVKEANK